MKTYILNGTVVLEQKVEVCDIEITDERITQIGKNLSPASGATVIDATGKYVFPGLVDFHTHFQESSGIFTSNETYTTGTNVGILNGVTTVNCFIVQNFNLSLTQAITSAFEMAKDKVYCDIRWHLTPTRFSDVNYGDIAKWIEKGFSTFKFYTTYKQENLYLGYDKLLEIIKRLSVHEPTILLHCEDDAIINGARYAGYNLQSATSFNKMRSEDAELTAVEKVIDICRHTQTDIVIAHVSSADALGQIGLAKRDSPILCEVTPPHVFLSDDVYYGENGHRFNIIPPLRSNECRRLMEVKVLLDYAEVFSSNHRVYSKDYKDRSKHDIRNVPQGLPTLGALFHLFVKLCLSNDGKMPLHLFYRKFSSNPARLAGIYPRKGVIAVDSDADILVVNMDAPPREIYGTLVNAYNPWEGMMTTYAMEYVFLRGQMVVKDDALVDARNKSGKILVG